MIKPVDIFWKFVSMLFFVPIIVAVLYAPFALYQYADEHWFYTEHFGLRIEDVCEASKIERGIYHADFKLCDEFSKYMRTVPGKVKVKDGKIYSIDVEVLIEGTYGGHIVRHPTIAQITACGKVYNYNIADDNSDEY